jgi:hypothetical protein
MIDQPYPGRTREEYADAKEEYADAKNLSWP